jgi:hypothetical protein
MLCSLSVCAPGCVVCSPSLVFLCQGHQVPTTTTATPPPLHAHTLCYHPAFLRIHSLLTAPFTSNLDTPSWLPQWDVFVAPPSHLPVSSVFRLQAHPVFSHSFLTTSFVARCLVASVGVLVAFSLTSGTYLSLSEFFSSFDFDMVYAVTLLSISDLVGLATL